MPPPTEIAEALDVPVAAVHRVHHDSAWPRHLSIIDLVSTVRSDRIETPHAAARELRIGRDPLSSYVDWLDLNEHLLSARDIALGEDDMTPAERNRG
jgi:hypothetical protein